MVADSHCPRCLALLPQGEACPSCQLGGPSLAPRFVPLPRELPAATLAQVLPERRPAPMALLAVLFGLLGFAMAWTPPLRPIAAAVSAVGVFLGVILLLPALSRGLSASGLPLAGALVSLQGLIVALALLPGPRPAPLDEDTPPAMAMIPGPPPAAPVEKETVDQAAIEEVRRAREQWKANPRVEAALTVGLPRLAHRDAAVRDAAAELLREVGPAALPFVVPMLTDEESEKRRLAARALAALGPAAKNEIKALLVAMNDDDATVRLHAARAVFAITLRTDLVEPTLKRCQGDGDAAVRREAAEALRAIEQGQPR